MATHDVPGYYPNIIQHNAHCRNGMPVSGPLARQIAHGMNHVAAHRTKLVFAKCLDLDSIPAGAAGTTTPWHFRCHAGHNAYEMVFDMLLATCDDILAEAPMVDWDVTIAGGATTTTDTAYYGAINAAPPDYPDGFHFARIRYVLPTKNETYEVELNLNDYARIAAATVYITGENPADDANTGVVDPRIGVGSPILDTDITGILDAGTELWQRNGVHLFSWSRDNAGSAPSETDVTYVNPFDGSVGNPTAATWGQRLVTTYMNSYSQTTIPCILAVRAQRTAGAGVVANNAVQLIDTAGTTHAEVTGIGNTEQWYMDTSVSWPAGTTKFDIQMRTDTTGAGDTVRLDAVCLYTYE
jgi:hypothetical protein